MTLTDIAARIDAHLKRISLDDASEYSSPSAVVLGEKIELDYRPFEMMYRITELEATRYLDWLDAGNMGRHWEME